MNRAVRSLYAVLFCSVDRTALYTMCGPPHVNRSVLICGPSCYRSVDGSVLLYYSLNRPDLSVDRWTAVWTAQYHFLGRPLCAAL